MNDEGTMYTPQDEQYEQYEKNEDTIPAVEQHDLNTGWKRVAIGSMSGILIGGAAAYAANQLMDDNVAERTDSVVGPSDLMATSVNDEMSFDDAFKVARDEVGSGGMFTWKGNVYSTYTPEEWDSMTPQEQLSYYATISGQEAPQQEPVVAQPHPQVQEVHHYHHVVDETPAQPEVQQNELEHSDKNIPNSDQHTTEDSGVHVIATSDVEQIGPDTYAQRLEVGGHAAVAVGTEVKPEVAIIDINDNLKLDSQDVIIDLQSGQAATMGEVYAQLDAETGKSYIADTNQEGGTESVDPNLHEVNYEPSVDPTMDSMSDSMADPGIVDPGMDMATDVPVFEC